jgi:hypothetical protein
MRFALGGGCFGSRTVKVDPVPGVLRTASEPPNSSTPPRQQLTEAAGDG